MGKVELIFVVCGIVALLIGGVTMVVGQDLFQRAMGVAVTCISIPTLSIVTALINDK
jgi:hypothetical protein